MKIRALKSFEGIKDLERDVYPKEGDIWEVDEERAKFLKSHNVIEYVEEPKVDLIENEFEVRSEEVKKVINEKQEELEEIIRPKKKKHK